MQRDRQYIASNEKAEIIIKSLCQKSPKTIAELAASLIKQFQIKPVTARSSVIRLVNQLMDIAILDKVGSTDKGEKLVDISPNGIYLLISSFPYAKSKYLKKEDIISYLDNKKKKELANLLKVCFFLEKEEETEEEEEKSDILNALEFEYELKGEAATDWESLEDRILEICLEILEDFIDKKGGTMYLEELITNLPNELKRAYKRILYSYKDKIDEEIQTHQLRKMKVQELIEKFHQIEQ